MGADGEPQFAGSGTGDLGLSSLLAQLEQDWSVAKGRLGINNPDEYGPLFSLRRELMELPYKENGTEESHTAWQDALKRNLVADPEEGIERCSKNVTPSIPAPVSRLRLIRANKKQARLLRLRVPEF